MFGNLDDQDVITYAGLDPERQRLSSEMQAAWIAFARSGDPNASGLPQWPRYDVCERATLIFGKQTEVNSDPLRARREVWGGLPFDGLKPAPEKSMQLMIINSTH